MLTALKHYTITQKDPPSYPPYACSFSIINKLTGHKNRCCEYDLMSLLLEFNIRIKKLRMLRQNSVMKEIAWNVPTFVSWLINPIRTSYILLKTEA